MKELPSAIVAKAKILINKINTGKFTLDQSQLHGDVLYLKLVQYPGYLAINITTGKIYRVNNKLNKTNYALGEDLLTGIWYYLASWTK